MASKFTASGVSFVNGSGTFVCYQAPNFTNPSGCAIILSHLFTTDGYEITPRVRTDIYQGSSVVASIINDVVIPSGASLETVSNKVVLTSGQSLQTSVEPSGSVRVQTSVLEIY
jgi:hypothetical protein